MSLASCTPRCFLYLLVVLLPAASAQKDPCWLASLQLRSGPKPVDMVPPFAPDTFAYSATLDFSSTFYDVDALAQSGCEVDSVPTQNVDVEPGASSALTVYAKDPETEERQAYVFTVTRMIGTETTVQALRIAGATLIPEFTPEVRAYAVDLGLGYETIKITYKLMDVGQKLRMTASQQVSAGTSLDLASTTVDLTPSGGFGAETRRLLSTGETQYLERSQSFLIDVGSSRRVTLTLESTDPMQALRGVYTLDVTRAPCTDARPLYSPISRACTVYCPSGFWANPASQRCSKCNSHCAVCPSLLQCDLCQQDTVRHRYIVRPDGSCAQELVTVEDKYPWWVTGFEIFLGFAVCLSLCWCFSCLYDCCCGSSRSSENMVYSDSDGELGSHAKRRRRRRICCCF